MVSMSEDSSALNSESDLKKKIAEITSKMEKRSLVIWAIYCVEHVLSYFEDKFPNDDRPRKAIEAAHSWTYGEISVGKVRSAAFAAHAAAREVDNAVACTVARAAGHATATVHVAGHAVHAANYAAKVDTKERVWQYEQLLELTGTIKEN